MWTSIRHLTNLLQEEHDTDGAKIDVAQLMEDRLALKNENVSHKQLISELESEIRRVKARYNAEKSANEDHIRLLFDDILVKTRRINELGEWQVCWQVAVRERNDVKDEEIRQLRQQLERREPCN